MTSTSVGDDGLQQSCELRLWTVKITPWYAVTKEELWVSENSLRITAGVME